MSYAYSSEKKLKKEYERKIARGCYELIHKPSSSNEDNIWSVFLRFADENGKVERKWLYCRHCKEVIKKTTLCEHDCYEKWMETHKDTEEISPTSDANYLSKEQIVEKISDGTYKLTLKFRKHIAYKMFPDVITNSEEFTGYVYCVLCKNIYKYYRLFYLRTHPCFVESGLAEEYDPPENKDNYAKLSSESLKPWSLSLDASREEILSYIRKLVADERESGETVAAISQDDKADKPLRKKRTEHQMRNMEQERIQKMRINGLIKNGTYKLTMTNGRSKVWKKFAIITDEEGRHMEEGYVCCIKCKHLYKFGATTVLLRHKCLDDDTKDSSEDEDQEDIDYDDEDDDEDNDEDDDDEDDDDEDNDEDDDDIPLAEFASTARNKRKIDENGEKGDEMDIIRRNIQHKISMGVYELTKNPESSQSLWAKFSFISSSGGTIFKGFVCCQQCKMVLHYNDKDETQMKNHICGFKENSMRIHSTDSSNENDDLPSRNDSESMDYSDNDEENEFIEVSSKSCVVKATPPLTQTPLMAVEKNPQPSMKPEIISNRPFKIQEVSPVVNIVNQSNSTLLKASPKDTIGFKPGETSAKLVLEEKLKKGIYKLFMKSNEKNLLWKIYAFIRKDDGSTEEFWVHCSHCKQLVEYKDNDATNLSHHKCYNTALQTMKEKDRQEALKVYSQWIIEDCRPITRIDGLGFQKMAKHFMSLGAKYGDKLQIEDIMPSAHTLREGIKKKYEARKLEIITKIREISNKSTISIDFWSDLMIKRSYLSISLHYVKDFQLYQISLALKTIDYNEEPPNEEIRKKLADLLNEFGLDNFKNLIFITEKNSHLDKALEDCNRLNCSCTLLAQVIDAALAKTPELSELIKACKEIKKYIKKSQNYSLMENSSTLTLCQMPYNLFKALNENWSKVKKDLAKLKETERIITDNTEKTLQSLMELCHKFEFILKRLQETRQPSLCFVIPSIQRLKVICKPLANDPREIAALKVNLLEKLEEIWLPNIQIWHKAAFFLYPPAKQEQAQDLAEIKEFCLTQMKSLQTDETELVSSSPTDENNDDDIAQDPDDLNFFFPILAKHSKASSTTTIANAEEEIKRYCAETVAIDKTFEVFDWWRKNSAKYPRLSRLASKILSIPSSARATELKYALNKNLMNERRNVFTPKNVDSILFLNSLAQKQEL